MISDWENGEQEQADMMETSVDDLPGSDGDDMDVDVDADDEADAADEMEDVQEDAAQQREDEGGYQ